MLNYPDLQYANPYLINPSLAETLIRQLEAQSEATEDDAKSGFNNLTNSRNVLTDTTGDNMINARGGDDQITTGNGDDTIYTGSGADLIFSGGGVDTITAGSGDDEIWAGANNDTVNGGSGLDNLTGEEGNDVLNGGSGNDILFGGANDDTLNGGLDDDHLFGDGDGGVVGGNDVLNGGYGNDTIEGGAGLDTMTGGTGADFFVFRVGIGTSNDSPVSAADVITDFSGAAGDRIDLSPIDWSSASGDQLFTFSNAPSTQAGRVWIEGSGADWTVFVNVNGGAADMAIDVHLATGTSLTAADFIL